jgi:hypothetical protein
VSELRKYLRGAKKNDLLEAQLLLVFSLYYLRPPWPEIVGLAEEYGLPPSRISLPGEEGRGFTCAAHLIEKAIELSERLTEGPQADLARLTSYLSQLSLSLIYCRLAEIAPAEYGEDFKQKSKERFASVSRDADWTAEPYHALVKARLQSKEVLPTGEALLDLVKRAEQGYRRRGQDYFVRLAKDYKKQLGLTEPPASN